MSTPLPTQANVLVGVTGSVAALRTPALVNALTEAGHAVRVLATDAACYFFDPKELAAGVLHRDADEWPGEGYRRGDPVLHIQLRRWADLLLVAPLDANTLAKLALGLCDNALTCAWRAWDLDRPVVLAPAMNTLMWTNPMTAVHLRRLLEVYGTMPPPGLDADALAAQFHRYRPGWWVVPPIVKRLADGDVGMGAMAEVPELVAAVVQALEAARMSSKKSRAAPPHSDETPG